MANGQPFQECQWEIGPIEHALDPRLSASFWEDETGTKPAESIVSAGETFYVKVEWELAGHLKRHFCGKWRVKIDLESIGEAPEYTSPAVTIDMDPCKNDPYFHIFQLTAGTLQPHPDGTVYLVATTVRALDPCGGDGHIWGFCKGPSVYFVP
jgi:hypothetical protein